MNRTVLVVEDYQVNQIIICRMLEKRGFQVRTALDGSVGVDSYAAGGIDFILMDLQMPIMDGFEAVQQIRTLERGSERQIPILAVTAYTDDESRERALTSGVDDIVYKPVTSETLFGSMAGILLRRFDLPDCLEHIPELRSELLLHEALREALDRIGNDRDLLREILETLVVMYDRWRSGSSSAIERNDHVALQNESKRLASSARNLILTPNLIAAVKSVESGPECQRELPSTELLSRCRAVGEELDHIIRFTNFFIHRVPLAAADEGDLP